MIIIGDATTWSISYNCHSDDSRGVIYNFSIYIIQATVFVEQYKQERHNHGTKLHMFLSKNANLNKPDLPTRFSLKKLPWTNTLAYLVSVTKKKVS
jgi:hypothetical protein